jgi:hypothetical protein
MKKKASEDPNGASLPAKSSGDDAVLVETFRAEKARANWGDNGPKPAVYTEAMKVLARSETISGGGPKNVQAVKNRWQKVSTNIFFLPG